MLNKMAYHHNSVYCLRPRSITDRVQSFPRITVRHLHFVHLHDEVSLPLGSYEVNISWTLDCTELRSTYKQERLAIVQNLADLLRLPFVDEENRLLKYFQWKKAG